MASSTNKFSEGMMMRAIAVATLKGKPQLMVLPKPTPRSDQLLVKVSVAGMNPFDWQLTDGVMTGVLPNVLPFVMGIDAAGSVVEIGSAVSRFRVGDRGFGQFFHSPLGEGTYAEYCVVPETATVAKLPDSVSDEVAAALPTAAMTALSMIDSLQGAKCSSLVRRAVLVRSRRSSQRLSVSTNPQRWWSGGREISSLPSPVPKLTEKISRTSKYTSWMPVTSRSRLWPRKSVDTSTSFYNHAL